MQRRDFIALLGLGGAAIALPMALRAPLPARLPTIGFLGPARPSLMKGWTDAFVQRLSELSWVVGNNVSIEYRWAEGLNHRFADFATEFINRKVDAIVTAGTPPVLALKQATSTIPIVSIGLGDPVANGLVQSLARPGGNVTGVSNQSRDLAGKRLDLLRDLVPGLRRMAILANLGNAATLLEVRSAEAAARKLGYEVAIAEIRRVEDIAPAFDNLKGRVDAVYVAIDALVNTNRHHINDLALNVRLPIMSGGRESVEEGGLVSYGPNFPALWRRGGDYVDKILRGANPAEMPVEQPTKFELVVNLKTAKALGLDVPPLLLARADEVIEF